ncbi:MAG: GNAT family N-acetyltransferase [Erysipelotrichaceae bacterium]|nr:GNAT family N-acetyltransferase [Erysipelotrichaceae bacterium]
MKVVPYSTELKQEFIEMNKKWIEDMFKIEPLDIEELNNIESSIDKGGQIFYTLDDDNEVMACCMIAPRDDGDWKILKFAAKDEYKGRGAGKLCLQACIDYAKEKHVEKIIIVSNHKCEAAVHLYRKFGFVEIPVDRKQFPFDRASIAFEMILDN